MDATGAHVLRKRLEEQEHWRQAEAVRDGRQPATDPDFLELAEIGDGVRWYGREQKVATVEGRSRLVTYRLRKKLDDGWWQASLLHE